MKIDTEKEKKLSFALNKLKTLDLRNPTLNTNLENLSNQKKIDEKKKETEFSEKIDELNQETDTLLEEIDKWQM